MLTADDMIGLGVLTMQLIVLFACICVTYGAHPRRQCPRVDTALAREMGMYGPPGGQTIC